MGCETMKEKVLGKLKRQTTFSLEFSEIGLRAGSISTIQMQKLPNICNHLPPLHREVSVLPIFTLIVH